MKKLLFISLVLFSCSEDDSPVFKMEDPFFESRFEQFVEIAAYYDVTIPRNNMILRFVTPNVNDGVNNSRAYKDGEQLYIDIDRGFMDLYTIDNYTTVIIFQQLANGLVGTPFRTDCGMMKKINTPEDMPEFNSLDYGDYPVLFDPDAPCFD